MGKNGDLWPRKEASDFPANDFELGRLKAEGGSWGVHRGAPLCERQDEHRLLLIHQEPQTMKQV